MEWYVQVMNKYAEFNGRARRSEYWYFVLVSLLISLAIFIIESLIGLFGIFATIYSLGVLIPSLAVAIRRLHDTGRSGWTFLLCLIPLAGAIILIVFLAQDSEFGDNEYGTYPK